MNRKKFIILSIFLILIILIIIGVIIFMNQDKIINYECIGPVTETSTYSISTYYNFTFDNDMFKIGEMNYTVKFKDEKSFSDFDFKFVDKDNGYEMQYDYDNLTRKYTYQGINLINENEISLNDYLDKVKNNNFTCELKEQ